MENENERNNIEHRRKLLEEIFGFEEDDSLIGEESDGEEQSDCATTDYINNHLEESNNVNAEEGPLPGMIFNSIESLMNAYQEHERVLGFAVAKRSAHKKSGESYKYVTICCDRGRKQQFEKSTKRINCPARINAIRRDNGVWQVSKTISGHNHELQPDMSILMPAHRNLTINMKRQLEANDIAGIRPCKNVRMLEVQAGGPQNLGCLPKDCRNFIEIRIASTYKYLTYARARARLYARTHAYIYTHTIISIIFIIRLQFKTRSTFV